MVGLKGKIHYEVFGNISILCCFVLDFNKIVLAVYAGLMLYYIIYNVILRICYCNLWDIMY